MTHVKQCIYAGHEFHVCLIVHEVGIGLDGGSHLVEVVAILQFDVHHTAMDARTGVDSHGEGSLDTFHSLDGYGVAHAHARTEVGIGDAFRGNGLQQSAYYGVTSRIPAGGNDGHRVVSLCLGVQRAAQVGNAGMDVKTVYRVDTQGQNLLGILLHAAGGRTEDGHVHTFQLLDVLHYRVVVQFSRTVLGSCAAYDTGNLEIRRSL